MRVLALPWSTNRGSNTTPEYQLWYRYYPGGSGRDARPTLEHQVEIPGLSQRVREERRVYPPATVGTRVVPGALIAVQVLARSVSGILTVIRSIIRGTGTTLEYQWGYRYYPGASVGVLVLPWSIR